MTVDPDTGEIVERTIRPFADWLVEHRNAALANELSETLNDLVDAVNSVGKAGTLTLTLKVAPASKHGEGIVNVADDVKVKLPHEPGEATYFVTADANLSRSNPMQPSLPLAKSPVPTPGSRRSKPMPSDNLVVTQPAEAEVVRDLAQRVSAPHKLDNHYYVLVVPDGHQPHYIDTEFAAYDPFRKRGEIILHDADSFCEFVNRHKDEDMTTIYANRRAFRFVAVLNDAVGAQEASSARWADHRAHLGLSKTDEWNRWANRDGNSFSQVEFAEFLEQGVEEIVSPPAAEMLELSTTFHAHTSATFRSATVLQSGERKLTYDESIEASAGRSGEMAVPTTFELALRPFEASPTYKVTARLRYRVNGGKLSIGYVLVRPEDVLRDAFDDERTKIEAATGVPTFAGEPPYGVGSQDRP